MSSEQVELGPIWDWVVTDVDKNNADQMRAIYPDALTEDGSDSYDCLFSARRQLIEALTALRDKEAELTQTQEERDHARAGVVWFSDYIISCLGGTPQPDDWFREAIKFGREPFARAERAEAALAAADAKCDARVAELKREYDVWLERERKVSHELRAERDAAQEECAKVKGVLWPAILDITYGENFIETIEWNDDSSETDAGNALESLREAMEKLSPYALPAPPSVPAKEGDVDTAQVSQ